MFQRSLSRVIPQVSERGRVSIPAEEWDRIGQLLRDEFDGNANFVVHDHIRPGAYHGGDYISVPHYLLQLEADEEELTSILAVIDPVIDEIIDTHTETNVPVAS
jgi:hypothetical protein